MAQAAGDVALKDLNAFAMSSGSKESRGGADRPPDWITLGVTSLNSNTLTLIDPPVRPRRQSLSGSQPMDTAFHGDELFVVCGC